MLVRGSRTNEPDRPLSGVRALGVALILGTLARVSFVHAQSFTMDEISELRIAKQSVHAIIAEVDGFPPLYHLLLHGWLNLFGTDLAARWLSVIFGILTIPVLWKLGKILIGETAAGLAAIVLAVLPFHIWYSQEGRAYALYIFLAALTLRLFFRARQGGNWPDWAWFVLAATAGLYVHYFFAVLLATLGLLLIVFRENGDNARRTWSSLIVVGFLAIPDLFIFWGDFAYQADYKQLTFFDFKAFGYTYFSILSGFALGPSTRELHTIGLRESIGELLPWLLILALAVGYPVLAAIRRGLGKAETRTLLVLAVVPVLAVGIVSTLVHVGYNVRYVLWVVVPCLLLYAQGLEQTLPRWSGRIALLLLVITFGVSRWSRVTNDRYREEDSRALAAYLEAQKGEYSDLVQVTAYYMSDPVAYYLGDDWLVERIPRVYASGEQLDVALRSIRSALGDRNECWLVYSRPFHGDPGGVLLEYIEPALIHATDFAGIRLYRIDSERLAAIAP